MSRLLLHIVVVAMLAAMVRLLVPEPEPLKIASATSSNPRQELSPAPKPHVAVPSTRGASPAGGKLNPASAGPARMLAATSPTVDPISVERSAQGGSPATPPSRRSHGLIEALGGAPAASRSCPAPLPAPEPARSTRRRPAPASSVVDLPLSGRLGGDPLSSGRDVTSSLQAPSSNVLALGIIAIALSELGRVDYAKRGLGGPHGWSHLQNLIADATGQRPADGEMQRTWKPHGISWCGVWAIWVYRQAGVNVRWKLTRGAPEGGIEKRWPWDFNSRAGFEASVRPGDIVVGQGPLWHHSIVVAVAADGSLDTVSGNTMFGRIVRRSSPHLRQVTAILRPRSPVQEH